MIPRVMGRIYLVLYVVKIMVYLKIVIYLYIKYLQEMELLKKLG